MGGELKQHFSGPQLKELTLLMVSPPPPEVSASFLSLMLSCGLPVAATWVLNGPLLPVPYPPTLSRWLHDLCLY